MGEAAVDHLKVKSEYLGDVLNFVHRNCGTNVTEGLIYSDYKQ